MAKPGGEILIAAVDRVDVTENRFAGGGEHANEDHDGWSKGLRSDQFGGAEIGGAFDIDAVSI